MDDAYPTPVSHVVEHVVRHDFGNVNPMTNLGETQMADNIYTTNPTGTGGAMGAGLGAGLLGGVLGGVRKRQKYAQILQGSMMKQSEIREMFEKEILSNYFRSCERYPLEPDDEPDYETYYVDDNVQSMWRGYLFAMESLYVSRLRATALLYRNLICTNKGG